MVADLDLGRDKMLNFPSCLSPSPDLAFLSNFCPFPLDPILLGLATSRTHAALAVTALKWLYSEAQVASYPSIDGKARLFQCAPTDPQPPPEDGR